MRQVVLDTETTGLEVQQGHRIIEIGCVEIINRRLTGRTWHYYLNPQRDIDEGAQLVHGITSEFLQDKPLFEALVDDFLGFVQGAELVIHNAAFDIGFLDNEIQRAGYPARLKESNRILDTLGLARQLHPGQKNNLDALCKRYAVNNSQRDKHGALLDAELLAEVYLAMTGGQADLSLDGQEERRYKNSGKEEIVRIPSGRTSLPVLRADATELEAHQAWVSRMEKKLGRSLW